MLKWQRVSLSPLFLISQCTFDNTAKNSQFWQDPHADRLDSYFYDDINHTHAEESMKSETETGLKFAHRVSIYCGNRFFQSFCNVYFCTGKGRLFRHKFRVVLHTHDDDDDYPKLIFLDCCVDSLNDERELLLSLFSWMNYYLCINNNSNKIFYSYAWWSHFFPVQMVYPHLNTTVVPSWQDRDFAIME